ncbi:MAG TPA: HlyD family efflux transporter periplasmic adaptor subunit [Thermoanaerobaculia bacterium]|nr:HlyD family efflux transporter periplasmic adaptor subunit [Thermoanaerobaculia bacterium]
MDRPIQPDVRRRRLVRRVVPVAIGAAALIFFFAATVQFLRPSAKRRDLQFARVERGSVDATLQASGILEPAYEQVVSSPVEARVLRIDRRAGDRVHIGDGIVTLDTAATKLDLDRLDSQVAQKETELAQVRLKADDNVASLMSQLDQKKLDSEILRYKAEQNRKLHTEGLVSAQDDMAAATASKKSEIEVAQLHEAVGRARRTASAEVDAAQLALTTARKERDESRRQLQLAMAQSDRDGVLTWVVPDAGAMVRKGDVIARVADLSAFRVSATITDGHASQLKAGMRARVRLDDATAVMGTISSVDPRIENGLAKFYVELDDRTNAKFRNNLRVDVFAITGSRSGVLTVRRGALGDSSQNAAFVVKDGEAVRAPVRFGLVGQDTIEIASGLHEGDEIIISDMSDYANVKTLRIKRE